MRHRGVLSSAESCGDGFFVCYAPFAGVTNAFFVIAGSLNMAMAISGLQTIEIVALGCASLAVTIAGSLLLRLWRIMNYRKNLPTGSFQLVIDY